MGQQSNQDGLYGLNAVLPPRRLSVGDNAEAHGALGGHGLRVSLYSYILARQYGLDEEHCERLRRAAAFHDIGKSTLPKELLAKPGRLTHAERLEVQSHTVRGYKLLQGSNSPTLREASVIALCHHEHVDGSGYPHGRTGAEIPLVARITSVTDVYDALTSHRVYRAALDEDEVLLLIDEGRGSHFDSRVVDALFEALERYPGLGDCVRQLTEDTPDVDHSTLHTRDLDEGQTQEAVSWLEQWRRPDRDWTDFHF